MFDAFGWISFTTHTKVAAFVQHLREGRLVASRCTSCGRESFPPRADCDRCLGGDFEFVPRSGRGHVVTYSRISAAPAGFEGLAPYVIGVVDLAEGGRALAWFGDTVSNEEIAIGMEVQIVPQQREVAGTTRYLYSLERPPGH